MSFAAERNQEATRSRIRVLPQDPAHVSQFSGVWEGECLLERSDGTRIEFGMELHVPSNGVANEGAVPEPWKVVYHVGDYRSERDFPSGNDTFGSVRYSSAEVNGWWICHRVECRGDTLFVEMVSYQTGKPTLPHAVQRGELKRRTSD